MNVNDTEDYTQHTAMMKTRLTTVKTKILSHPDRDGRDVLLCRGTVTSSAFCWPLRIQCSEAVVVATAAQPFSAGSPVLLSRLWYYERSTSFSVAERRAVARRSRDWSPTCSSAVCLGLPSSLRRFSPRRFSKSRNCYSKWMVMHLSLRT